MGIFTKDNKSSEQKSTKTKYTTEQKEALIKLLDEMHDHGKEGLVVDRSYVVLSFVEYDDSAGASMGVFGSDGIYVKGMDSAEKLRTVAEASLPTISCHIITRELDGELANINRGAMIMRESAKLVTKEKDDK